MNKEILLVSISFSPNVGGTETHYDDMVGILNKRGWKVWWLTYKPITVELDAPFVEKKGSATIYRIAWPRHLFYKLVEKPLFEFLYLIPGLFVGLPLVFLFKARNAGVIHAHGLIAGFAAAFWGRIFKKKVITSTHSIYHFPESGKYRKFAKWIFENSAVVLTLSKQSKEEIKKLGIDEAKISVFTYWIDLKRFKRVEKAKGKLNWKGKFVVLYVGRLVREKGIYELMEAARRWDKKITLVIAGTGPIEPEIKKAKEMNWNILYLGKISQEDLPLYYSAADVLIVPSTHEEGFGRVILESLACGTPVIGANRGAIPEAMDETVGKLIEVTPENIKRTVEYFYKNPKSLRMLAKKARKFAEERYSEKNAEDIIHHYEKN